MEQGNRRGAGVPEDAGEVASCAECTGLIPALPRDDAEEASDRALWPIQPARRPRNRGDRPR